MVREFSTRVAGIHYCKGNVSGLNRGDVLRLVREPANPYDRNAIRVEMPGGVLVGRIPREVAASLADDMDVGLRAYAVIQSTSYGHAPVAPVYGRGGRVRRRGVKASPPECYIAVKVGDAGMPMPEFPRSSPPPPSARIQRPVPPPPAPVRPTPQPVAPKSSCFVATAVFCDAEHPTVAALREWRDTSLAGNRVGRALIQAYSVAGPRLARLVWAAPVSRRLLAPLLTLFARMLASGSPRVKPTC